MVGGDVFTLTIRYDWKSPMDRTYGLLQSPCICCGDNKHSVIGTYRDNDHFLRRVFDCPVISGTDPDPFYDKADSAMYLGLSLNPEVFAELYHYDKKRIKEFFGQENKFIIHPARVKSFRKLVLDQCDVVRTPWEFKRELPRTDFSSDDEMDISEDDTSSITLSEDSRMDC